MEVWRDIVLIIAVLGVFVFGYFLMARLDRILDENRKAIEKENEKKEPSCVMLTGELTEEEITEEIRRFRSKHVSTQIMLYDSNDISIEEPLSDETV